MAIKITFLNDIVNFLKGTKDMGAALEQVEDSLTDVADEAERAGDQSGKALSDGVSDGARDGQRALDRLEREFTDTSKTAKREMDDTAREAKRSGDKIADDLGGGFEKAGDAAGDMAGDGGDAIGDVVTEASKGGDDIGGALIDGISAASALIPGIGAGIGTAVAGIATGVYDAWRESSENTEQRTSNMYNDMIASGQSYLSYTYIEAEITRMIDEGQIEEIQTKADLVGVSWSEMARALAGSTSDLETVLAAAGGKVDELQAKIDAGTTTSLSGNSGFIGVKNQVTGLIGEMEGVGTSLDTATAKAQLFADTMAGVQQEPVTVPVEADTAAAEEQIAAASEDRETTVEAQADTADAGQDLTQFTSAQRSTTVKVAADMSAAESALFTFLTKPRPAITIQARLVDPRGVPVE